MTDTLTNTEEMFIDPDPVAGLDIIPRDQMPDGGNVLAFPVRTRRDEEFVPANQGVTADQAPPQGNGREEIAYRLGHEDYIDSVKSIKEEIARTHIATLNEKIRRLEYSRPVNPDLVADAKSELAFLEIGGLTRPAGASVSSLGSTALKIDVDNFKL